MPFLDTPRLHFRPLTMDDFDWFFANQGDAELMRYIRPPETNPEPVRERIEFMLKYASENPGLGSMVVHLKATDQPIASCILRHIEYLPENGLEVGYMVSRAFWGHGLGTEIASSLVRYASEKLGADNVTAFVDPENLASQRVLEKSGFQLVGPRHIYDSDNLELVWLPNP